MVGKVHFVGRSRFRRVSIDEIERKGERCSSNPEHRRDLSMHGHESEGGRGVWLKVQSCTKTASAGSQKGKEGTLTNRKSIRDP